MMATRNDPGPWTRWLAVFVGGVVGTAMRLGLGAALPVTGGWPWATFLANLSGALALGLLLGWALEAATESPHLLPFLSTGVLGSYTTFSILSVETIELAASGGVGIAGAYGLSSMTVGYALAWAGLRLGGRSR